MDIWKPDVLYKADLILGEGARWHAGWEKFLFIDIKGKLIGTCNPVNGKLVTRKISDMPGMLAPAGNNKLLVALQGKIVLLDLQTGETITLAKFKEDAQNRSNDGACDALGRLWVGTMNIEAKHKAGNLYCFNGKLIKKIKGTSVSNGICWSPDNRILYYIDSFQYHIKAFDYDLATGNISNERVVVQIIGPDTVADGMCIDTEGMLWVAIWGGGCVNRYNPHNGNCIGKILVNAPNVTSCAFGGKQMNQMLITTAKDGLNAEELKQYPHSGSLFMIKLNITGLPTAYYRQP
ncbi:SMP-30/gluconolactonase/LRE family protein [Pedobacter sp. 22226]|uniref:SMP-30/gluconolactonase/LRE family protein n=1 Tax=Pedobacter sp. 22226 TaxID=3453894 RepID=UPI003F86A854